MAPCMRRALAGVKGSHAQTGMLHIRAFVQSSLHLDMHLDRNPRVEMQRRLHTTREENCTNTASQDRGCRVCHAALH